MGDFFIQILSTLISTLIIFIISKSVKYIKKIPKEKIYNFLFKIVVVFLYLTLCSNFIVTLKIMLKIKFGINYIIGLVATSFCFYSAINCSLFVREVLDIKIFK